MKLFFHFQTLAVIVAGLFVACWRVDAQSFGFSVTNSASPLIVNNFLTYTINLTNQTGFLLPNVFVTNALSASATFVAASATQGSVFTNANNFIFSLGTMENGGFAQISLTIQPTATGFLTNGIIVGAFGITNPVSTNIVTQVITAQADLGVTMTGPNQIVITNDLMTYGIVVTNLGPGAAPNVVLTNTLPAGVLLKSVVPANQTYTVASSNLIFNLGTMANGSHASLLFRVQPTNAGVLTFSASVSAAGLLDSSTTNNLASTNIAVIVYPPGTLVAVTNSAQTSNLQNGLGEQSILLSNMGTNDVAAARVVVTGLTNQLSNAVGTNNDSPFVYYSAPLAAGKSVNLLLQYNPRGSFPFTNGQLHAFAVPLPNWTPPKAISISTNVNVARVLKLSNGNMLIEFPSTLGRAYTVVYSDNVSFSNAMIAPPSIVAPANRVQWIDYGPPTTKSAPTNSSARFYRVFQNP